MNVRGFKEEAKRGYYRLKCVFGEREEVEVTRKWWLKSFDNNRYILNNKR